MSLINLPSKKIIALGIVAVGIVSSVVLSRYLKNHPEIFAKNENPEITKNTLSYSDTGDIKSLNNIDTDADGLKDWEELLWGTDTQNKDSDRDGSIDGDEIKEKRDPAKPGPNDFLSQYTVEGEKVTETKDTTPQNLNASDVFSQQLFSKYMSLKNTEADQDPDSTSSLVGSMTDQALSTFSFREYNKTGLVIFPTSDKDSVRFYASSFALIYLDFLKKIQAVTNSIKTDADLANLSRVYADFAEALYQMKIPGQIVNEHLAILNDISIQSSAFVSLSKFKEDPVPALSALKAYKTAGENQSLSLSTIGTFLRNNDIIFTDGIEANFWKNF